MPGWGHYRKSPGGVVLVVQPQATLQVFEDMARLGIQMPGRSKVLIRLTVKPRRRNWESISLAANVF